MTCSQPRRDARNGRRGVVLVLVLSCLFIVALVGVALLRSALVQHRQVRMQQRQLQAFWLAESGVLRASASLRRDPGYAGETWQLAVDPERSAMDGRVEIRVAEVEGQPQRRRVQVEARYPVSSSHGVVQRRMVMINVTTQGESE